MRDICLTLSHVSRAKTEGVWGLLGVAIYLYGVNLTAEGGPLIVALSYILAIGQLVLLWSAWTITGEFFNLYAILFLDGLH
jgi:hypothetical protein